jgi:hypothetical protein
MPSSTIVKFSQLSIVEMLWWVLVFKKERVLTQLFASDKNLVGDIMMKVYVS